MAQVKDFSVFDMITQDRQIIPAISAKEAAKYYFLKIGIKKSDPVQTRNQTGIKSLWDARFIVTNQVSKRTSFFNKDGYAFDTANHIEYPL